MLLELPRIEKKHLDDIFHRRAQIDAEAPTPFCYGTISEFSAFALYHGVKGFAGKADFQAKTTGEEIFVVNWLLRLGWPVLCCIVP
jgi:hypothetical protein